MSSDESAVSRNTNSRHSGARRRREPGIQ